jgi:AraC family transcriptional activator of tynA and feaB
MTFSADITPSTARDGLAAFRREWDARIDQPWPLPGYSIGESGDLRVKVRAVKAHDVVLLDVCNYGGSFTGRTTGDLDGGDRVLAHLMRRGAWHFARPNGRGETVTVPAGSSIALDNGPPSLVEVDPGATAKVLTLPASVLAPLMGGRQIVGSARSARSAEVRVLMAHANIVCETVHDLTPAGLLGARDALLELVRGTLMREFDDVEPRLAPALARAAMEIADSHLADAELSPSSLARELNVSVRTSPRRHTYAAGGLTRPGSNWPHHPAGRASQKSLPGGISWTAVTSHEVQETVRGDARPVCPFKRNGRGHHPCRAGGGVSACLWVMVAGHGGVGVACGP